MKVSVRVMLSYDYNHFEVCLGSDDDKPLGVREANDLRKTAQRLADEAVRQFKRAKEAAAKRASGASERAYFLQEVERIQKLPPEDRTVRQIAVLKQFSDDEWESQFMDDYDYDDDQGFDPAPHDDAGPR